MKIIQKIFRILSYLCYTLIGIYVLICAPYIIKYKPLVVLTGSMEPTFHVGSIIYYKQVPQEELNVGDIITFKYDDTIISHRINQISGTLYETKGDANNTADQRRISYNEILGKDTTFCIPYLGFFVKFINDNMYLLIIVAIILVSDFILSNICNKNKGEQLNEE